MIFQVEKAKLWRLWKYRWFPGVVGRDECDIKMDTLSLYICPNPLNATTNGELLGKLWTPGNYDVSIQVYHWLIKK